MSRPKRDPRTDQYFIVIKNIKGESASLTGTIWILEYHISPTVVLVTKYEGDDSGMLKQIDKVYLKVLTYDEVHVLLSIPEPITNRLIVVSDNSWIQEGLNIKVGVRVRIYDFPGLEMGATGTVRFKGRLPGKNGTSFGVELDEQYSGKGTTDGTFRHKRLFRCNDDCGIFVSIIRLRKIDSVYNPVKIVRPEAEGQSTEAKFSEMLKPTAAENTKQEDNNLPGETYLEIDENVVWMSDDGPEFGVVKWIGILPQSGNNNVIVGVEFDNPVGSGTGKYRGAQLFQARRNHASLIPILGLLKADVYMSMMSSDITEHDKRLSSNYPDIKIGDDSNRDQDKIIYPTSDIRKNEEWIEPSNQIPSTDDAKEDNKLLENFSALDLKPRGSENKFELLVADGPSDDSERGDYIGKGARPKVPHSANVKNDSGIKSGDSSKLDTNSSNASSGIKSGESSTLDSKSSSSKDSVSSKSTLQADSGVEVAKHITMREYEQQYFDFQVGSRVCVNLGGERYGVIRWMGTFPSSKTPERIVAGIEMEAVDKQCYTDGRFLGDKVFDCPPYKGFFFPLNKCLQDRRSGGM